MPKTQVADLDVVWDAAGPETGEPVLMINGLGAVRGSWAIQVEALSRRYRVYSYDNRDVGETGAGRDPRPYGIRQFARDAEGLIQALEIAPVHVIGASMGGAIAIELALERPDLLRSVQIVCAWARSDAWLDELLRQWRIMFSAMGAEAWGRSTWVWVLTHRWFQESDHITDLARDLAAYPYPQTAEMFARQADAAMTYDAIDRLGELFTPAHIIAGTEDILTPPRFSAEIAAGIPSSRLTVLPDVGHGMFWETPDAFNDALLGFLAANPG